MWRLCWIVSNGTTKTEQMARGMAGGIAKPSNSAALSVSGVADGLHMVVDTPNICITTQTHITAMMKITRGK